MSRRTVAAFVLGFLLLRAVLFAITSAGEYRLYRDYGEAARDTSLADLYQTRDVEYPHLAVQFGAAAAWLADRLPPGTRYLVRLRPAKFEWPYRGESPEDQDAGDRYEAAFSLLVFAVDAACLALVYLIARKVYPDDGPAMRLVRLIGYAVATGLIGLILFDRQDLVVGFFALLALLALTHGRPWLGYAVLVVGTAYKLVPVLLLPVWVLAAAVARAGPGATPWRYLRAVVIEAAVAGLMLAAWPVLTYQFGGGERAFLFLTFHSDRGLQLEAPVAWPVLLAEPATEIGHSYGSFNLRGELADAVAKPLKPAMALAVLVGVAIAARGFWRAASRPNHLPEAERGLISPPSRPGKGGGGLGGGKGDRGLGENPSPTPPRSGEGPGSSPPSRPGKGAGALGSPGAGGLGPLIPHVVASSLLIWLGFILTNKVGSPQYMLWVAPLAPLLPLRTASERWWGGLLLVVLLLTTVIFPCAYKDVLGPIVAEDPRTWAGPTPACLFLLAAKSVTLAVVTVWLGVSLWRHPRIPAPIPSPEPRPAEAHA